MLITPKLGKILRGAATPSQLYSASVLTSVVGFMPGFSQAWGTIVAILLLLIVLNANLVLGAFAGLAAKLVSLLLMPVTFAVGRFLLDGPTQGLFQALINAPVFALFGMEYYLTAGGYLMGTLFGIVFGYLSIRIIDNFRKKMAALDDASEQFKDFNAKGWVKAFKFIFVGGKMKQSFQEIFDSQETVGNSIRPLGLGIAVMGIAVLFCAQMFFGGAIMTAALRSGLERANGATVDVESAVLSLKENRLVVTGLAVADPNALGTDLLRAATLEADVSAADLLRKRIHLKRVVISQASSGDARKIPGRRVGRRSAEKSGEDSAGAESIDDYVEDAKRWKERLSQIRNWLEKLSGPERETKENDDSFNDRLEREIAEVGYRRVKASHLITGSPTFTVSELVADTVRIPQMGEETLSIVARNISTQPWLLEAAPELVVNSSGESVAVLMRMGESAITRSVNVIDFNIKGLETDLIVRHLKLGGAPAVQGGLTDLTVKGLWVTAGGVKVDLPLEITFRDATLSLSDRSKMSVESLSIRIGIEGPLENPRIKTESKRFAETLAKAGFSAAREGVKE
jgi:uncharacterized protein (TIGR03546 family)